MQARIGFLQGSEVWLFTITRKTQRMYASKHRVPARSRDWFVTISKNTKHTHNAWMQARIGFLQGLIFQQDSEVFFFFSHLLKHMQRMNANRTGFLQDSEACFFSQVWTRKPRKNGNENNCTIPRFKFSQFWKTQATHECKQKRVFARFRGLIFHSFMHECKQKRVPVRFRGL